MTDKEDIEMLVEDTLNINVGLDGNDFATVDVYGIDPEMFGDGRCIVESMKVQIDIYYLYENQRDAAIELLKQALSDKANYSYPYISIYYDDIADRYRAVFRFNIIKRKE